MINDVARKGQYWWKKNKKIKKKKTLKACLTRAQNLFPPSGVWMQKWSTQFALFHELSLFGLVSCSPGLGYLTARRMGRTMGRLMDQIRRAQLRYGYCQTGPGKRMGLRFAISQMSPEVLL